MVMQMKRDTEEGGRWIVGNESGDDDDEDGSDEGKYGDDDDDGSDEGKYGDDDDIDHDVSK